MIVLALLLIALAAVVSVAVILEATGSTSLEIADISLSTTALGMFLIGAATMLALLLGVALLSASAARARRKRSAAREEQRHHDAELQRLAREKAELEERLRREHSRGPTTEQTTQRLVVDQRPETSEHAHRGSGRTGGTGRGSHVEEPTQRIDLTKEERDRQRR